MSFIDSLEEVNRAPINKCALTKEQNDQIQVCLAYAVFHQPFFAHLLMSKLSIIPTRDIPIAATDSHSIFINPDTFFKYELAEQGFILYHEVMHCVWGDLENAYKWRKDKKLHVGGTDLEYDDELMNQACDYVINALLITSGCGKYNPDWLYKKEYSEKGAEASVDIYEKLLKKKPKGSKGGPTPRLPGQFDHHLNPGAEKGQDPAQAVAAKDSLSWKGAIAAAAQSAEMQGKLPAGLKRLVGELLEPKVSWQDHIRASLARVHGSGGYDWSFPDRRMISRPYPHDPVFFARESGFSCGTIVVGIDTSGSIGDAQVTAFFREMHGIFEDMNPRELVLMDCDAKVHNVHYVEDMNELEDVRVKGLDGGGGTSFIPVFEEIDRLGLEPDCVVYLTDLYGSFPDVPPPYPVIWGAITDGTAPFGETVHVEV